MLGLPASTQIKKLITKKKVYERFAAEMSAERRRRFDADIARITLTHEVSPASLNVADGVDVHAFFVVALALRKKAFDPQNIALIARLFGQRLVFVLSYGQEERLALWQTKLLMTAWHQAGSQTLHLRGLNMDAIWEGVVTQIGGFQVEAGRSLDEQIALEDKRAKLQKEVERLEKLAWAEKQPKRKLALVQEMKKRQAEMEAL